MKVPSKEWKIQVPWGHMALASWGDPSLPRVLLVHGRADSLATFIPLLELLPDKYYFVGVDLPGHGLSSHLPPGIALSRIHMLPGLVCAIEHLEWDKFTYIGHSMGSELAKYYNAIYPGRIIKEIDLDPGPTLFRMRMRRIPDWYSRFFGKFYDGYDKYTGAPAVHSRSGALALVQRARGLTAAQAELVLSRNMRQVGDDQYIITMDQRLKMLASVLMPPSDFLKIVSRRPPPTLMLCCTDSLDAPNMDPGGSRETKKLIDDMKNILNYSSVSVRGGHDVHLTHPERVAPSVKLFLEQPVTALAKL